MIKMKELLKESSLTSVKRDYKKEYKKFVHKNNLKL